MKCVGHCLRDLTDHQHRPQQVSEMEALQWGATVYVEEIGLDENQLMGPAEWAMGEACVLLGQQER